MKRYEPKYNLCLTSADCRADEWIESSAPSKDNIRQRLNDTIELMLELLEEENTTLTLELKRYSSKRTYYKLHSV